MTILFLAIIAIVILITAFQYMKLQRVVKKNANPTATLTNAELLVELSFDETTIKAKYPAGEAVVINWTDLTMIGVRATPAAADSASVYWGLHTGKSIPAISYPHDAIGDKALLAEFAKRLPGFDMEKVMKAVTTNGSGVNQIWAKR